MNKIRREHSPMMGCYSVTPYFGDVLEGLNVTDIVFCSYVRGDQDYDEQPDATYDSGDTVWMYYETSNFDAQKQDGTYDVWLKYSLKVFDSDNNIVYEDLNWGEFHESGITPSINHSQKIIISLSNLSKHHFLLPPLKTTIFNCI